MATEIVQPELAVYTVKTADRRMRSIEFVPLLGLLATPWINFRARDWNETEFKAYVPFDPNVEYSTDMRPYVTMEPGRYYQTYVSQPKIYPN